MKKRPKTTRRPPRLASAADVAHSAGVSVSAVSRTFTPGASVSPKTRERVLSAARKLRFHAVQRPGAAYSKGSRIIGVLLARLDNFVYPDLLERLSDRLGQMGYRVLLFVTHGESKLEPLVNEILHYRVDALVLASTSLTSRLAEECRSFGIPAVMYNAIDPESATPSVAGANFHGGQVIGQFFAAAGHRVPAFITGLPDRSVTTQERDGGFTSALRAAGLPEPVRIDGEFSYEGAMRAARELLSRKRRPDAIFCANDHMAIACLQVARHEFGLTPGKDLSIAGFDDSPIAAWPAFDLTTYSQSLHRVTERLIALIGDLLAGRDLAGVHESVPGELIVRSSAKVPGSGTFTVTDGRRIWSAAR